MFGNLFAEIQFDRAMESAIHTPALPAMPATARDVTLFDDFAVSRSL